MTAVLVAGAGLLGLGTYTLSQTLTLTASKPMSGLGRNNIALSDGGTLAPGQSLAQTSTNPTPNDYAQADHVLRGLSLISHGKNTVGLRVAGAYRVIEDFSTYSTQGTVAERGIGVEFAPKHTYAITLRDFEVYQRNVGVHFPTGLSDSGERIMLEDGTVFNNNYNFHIENAAWFLKWRGISSDYPVIAHIVTGGNALNLHISQSHIEGGPGVPFINALSQGADLGLVTLEGTTLVNTITPTSTFSEVVKNYTKGTVILQDCDDPLTGQHLNKVLTHYVPVTPVPGTVYLNEARATMVLTLDYDLAAGGAAAIYTGPTAKALSLAGFLSAGSGGSGLTRAPLQVRVPGGVLV